MNKLSVEQVASFQTIVLDYYALFGRQFDWRNTTEPYHIVVSEIMLQQTQTLRVTSKFREFIDQFPNFQTLAKAPFKQVLAAWNGLGYNRRAMYLQQIAQTVCGDYDGHLPISPATLLTFPGIGKNTAGSICAFAFNQPTIFIETNIRTVFIHFFFQDQQLVADAEIVPLIEQTVIKDNARHWYYALMDYGVMLKQQMPNPNRKSTHYMKQSKFQGSDRQIRGKILKLLTKQDEVSFSLLNTINDDEKRINKIIQELCNEGFIILKTTGIKLVD